MRRNREVSTSVRRAATDSLDCMQHPHEVNLNITLS